MLGEGNIQMGRNQGVGYSRAKVRNAKIRELHEILCGWQIGAAHFADGGLTLVGL